MLSAYTTSLHNPAPVRWHHPFRKPSPLFLCASISTTAAQDRRQETWSIQLSSSVRSSGPPVPILTSATRQAAEDSLPTPGPRHLRQGIYLLQYLCPHLGLTSIHFDCIFASVFTLWFQGRFVYLTWISILEFKYWCRILVHSGTSHSSNRSSDTGNNSSPLLPSAGACRCFVPFKKSVKGLAKSSVLFPPF